MRVEFVDISARDGTVLSAVVYRNLGLEKSPAVMVATPYDKMAPYCVEAAHYFVSKGYAFAALDIRGRYESGGEAYLYGKNDGRDVTDVITWIADQPWCTGKVGTFGGSYLGFAQLLAALEGAESHTCMVPMVSPDDHYDNVFPSGAFQLANSVRLAWLLSRRTNLNLSVHQNWDAILFHLPLLTIDTERLGFESPVWRDFLEHPSRDNFWSGRPGERIAPGRRGNGLYDRMKLPSFHISGWYDQVSQATINNYLGMVESGPSELRETHRLLMGPWTHEMDFEPPPWGDQTLPKDANIDFRETICAWFDRWLKGVMTAGQEAPVRLYVMGRGWRNEREWPLARTVYTDYYLRSRGGARTAAGDGSLSQEVPSDDPPDTFRYDPANPVPTIGGNLDLLSLSAGPRDQRPLEEREDILFYTSGPLTGDIEVTGNVKVVLHAASDCLDTDFTAKLVDLAPDGYAQIVLEGVIRARYRDSFSTPSLLENEKIYEYLIDLWSTSIVFKQMHRMRLEISSSNFPKYDRNPNTGGAFGRDVRLAVANQVVYHDKYHPSRLVLPVIPR